MSKLSREKQRQANMPDYGEGTFKYFIHYTDAMSEEVETKCPMACANGMFIIKQMENDLDLILNIQHIKKIECTQVPKPRESSIIIPDAGASNRISGVNFNGS